MKMLQVEMFGVYPCTTEPWNLDGNTAPMQEFNEGLNEFLQDLQEEGAEIKSVVVSRFPLEQKTASGPLDNLITTTWVKVIYTAVIEYYKDIETQ